jgi:hypothetical protein
MNSHPKQSEELSLKVVYGFFVSLSYVQKYNFSLLSFN